MKLLFIISSLLTVAVAQQPTLSCNYLLFAGTYVCAVSINNPNGLNNFTEIGGLHLQGFTNADVQQIGNLIGTSLSTNIPRIICDTFTNLERIDLFNIGLTEIDDSAFAGCSQLTELLLAANNIGTISANGFVNLPAIQYINLEDNSLTTLPENVFENQQNLTTLSIGSNAFEDIPIGIFRPLENLQILRLGNANLNTINELFTTNAHLYELTLPDNRISLTADSFVGLEGLLYLNLENNVISVIPVGAFAQIPNLRELHLYGNNFTELQADSFPDLGNLEYLNIGANPIGVIHQGAFRGLGNLNTLNIQSSQLHQLHSNSFEGLGNLGFLSLNFNEIEELPVGLFVPTPNLNNIGLWNNRLKTLRRDSFGTLVNLLMLDLDGNVVNAIDRAFIDDAVNLFILQFSRNLCADSYFGDFPVSRPQFLVILDRCFFNFRYIIETITESDQEYSFFEGLPPGIAFRVNTDNEVQITLTPFNFVWTPVIEIFIGSTNNTRSVIRRNQETDVVTVPTPNIITQNQWNDFRVTWANQNILVFRGNDTFPFMSYTMQDFYPVNFYGLRAIGTRASWTVQPFDL